MLIVKPLSVPPPEAKVPGPPLLLPRFLIFLPYASENKTLSLGQTILIASLWPKANDLSNVRRKTGPVSECFGLKVAGTCQHHQEHAHPLCTSSWVYTLWTVWLWIGCTERQEGAASRALPGRDQLLTFWWLDFTRENCLSRFAVSLQHFTHQNASPCGSHSK